MNPVNVVQDLSILELVIHASLVVKLVMVLLTIVSLMSWYWIFRKWFAIGDAQRRTDKFERDFWSGGDLNALYQSAVNNRHNTGPLERVFEAGYREFLKLHGQKTLDHSAVVAGIRRAMRATYQRELDDLDAHLSFLASVGSVSPYVGLFGTVWGIMHAFRGLANVSSATLAAVAPGIAEALVATAIGLFAAIPAVVAYNRFAHDVDRLSVRFESFMEEFANILQRQLKVNPVRQRRLVNQINVVPYIDVMLVLLIIFMVTAPMIQTGSVDLPTVGKSAAPPVAPLEVIIRADQSVALHDRAKSEGEVRVERGELAARIRAAQQANPQQGVLIAADRNVRYEAVLNVMDELQKQQVSKIGLLVQPGK